METLFCLRPTTGISSHMELPDGNFGIGNTQEKLSLLKKKVCIYISSVIQILELLVLYYKETKN